LGILLADLINLPKCPFSNQFEDLEVVGSKRPLLNFRELHPYVDLPGDVLVFCTPWLQGEKAFQQSMLLRQIQAKPHMS
jgi:hypothetical protein